MFSRNFLFGLNMQDSVMLLEQERIFSLTVVTHFLPMLKTARWPTVRGLSGSADPWSNQILLMIRQIEVLIQSVSSEAFSRL